MKTINTPEATFSIAERHDYTQCLSRRGKEVKLYKVTFPSTIYVLAESADDAVGQVHCIETASINHAKAEEVPFAIRGWGKTLF